MAQLFLQEADTEHTGEASASPVFSIWKDLEAFDETKGDSI